MFIEILRSAQNDGSFRHPERSEGSNLLLNRCFRFLGSSSTHSQSGCVAIRFADGRIQYIVGVRFIEPDTTGLMNQAPTL